MGPMKKLLIFALVCLGQWAEAYDFQTRLLIDKTYVRDNSYCQLDHKRFEIEIRSFDKYTEVNDSEYGEYTFVMQSGKQILLPINQDNLGKYRLFKGKTEHCTKSLAVAIGKDVLALLFLKDNRPLGDTLSVVLYNVLTHNTELIETNYRPLHGVSFKNKIKFQTDSETATPNFGKIILNGKSYIYQEKYIRPWMSYDGHDFEVDPYLSFEKSSIKNHFQNRLEFERHFGWNANSRKYVLERYLYAVNHELKEECLAIPFKPKKNLTQHQWKCKSMNFNVRDQIALPLLTTIFSY